MLQEIPATSGQGDWRLSRSTRAAVANPAQKVGSPRFAPRAEAARRTIPVAQMPSPAKRPPRLSDAAEGISRNDAAMAPASRQRKMPKVSMIAKSDGKANRASQTPSGGIPCPKTTRLAGLEIGRTKLAALATNAQIKR